TARIPEPRRTAVLLAAARHLEEAAVDDALDLFHVLMATNLIAPARRKAKASRLEAMPRLERASTTLAATTKAIVAFLESNEGTVDVAAAWATLEAVAPREALVGAADAVAELVPDDASEETALRSHLTAK